MWDPVTYDFPRNLKYKSKLDSDFYVMQSAKVGALGMALSNGQHILAIYGNDHVVRVWSLLTGRLIASINESVARAQEIQNDPNCPEHLMFKLDPADFERRVNLEREIERQPE